MYKQHISYRCTVDIYTITVGKSGVNNNMMAAAALGTVLNDAVNIPD